MADLPKLRAVVFQSGTWWVAQFLEYDLVALATSLEKLPREVERILTARFSPRPSASRLEEV